DRSRHHAGGSAAGGRRAYGAAGGRVDAGRAVHIVAVVAAIELEAVLIPNRSGYFAVGRHGRLQYDETVGVAAEVRHDGEGVAGDRLSDRGGGGLQLGARRGRNLHSSCNGADQQGDVERQHQADRHLLPHDLGRLETGLGDRDVVYAGWNI